jgi:hypothetical protein
LNLTPNQHPTANHDTEVCPRIALTPHLSPRRPTY